MEINIWAVVAATVVQVIIGFLWYGAIFGKAWGQIHGFDKLSKEKQTEMAGQMGPYYGLQVVVTIFTVVALAKLIVVLPQYSPYALALLAWIGFVFPTQYAAMAFGGAPEGQMLKKLAIMTAGSLVCLLAGAAVLDLI